MSKKIIFSIFLCFLNLNAHAEKTNFATGEYQTNIIGGVDAVNGEFPFMAAFQLSNGFHHCGASLIKKDWVLTAAHCLDGVTKDDRIVLGLHDRKNYEGTEIFGIQKVIIHPKYKGKTTDYDFALIKLSGESRFTPIALNSQEIDIPSQGRAPINVWTAGWGTTKYGSSIFPRILQKVEIPLVSADICNSVESYNGKITKRMICAGLAEGGKDSCQGDSGGPLFLQETSGQYTLVGVVSWGEGCARPNKYGVYSKVNNQIDWISQHIQ